MVLRGRVVALLGALVAVAVGLVVGVGFVGEVVGVGSVVDGEVVLVRFDSQLRQSSMIVRSWRREDLDPVDHGMDPLLVYLSLGGSHLRPVGSHPSSEVSLLGRWLLQEAGATLPRGRAPSRRYELLEGRRGSPRETKVTFPGLSNGVFRGVSQEASGVLDSYERSAEPVTEPEVTVGLPTHTPEDPLWGMRRS